MTKFGFLMVIIALCGCAPQENQHTSLGVDQCNRQEQMLRCLSTTPAGPQATNKSDWSDVVDNCSSAAYYSSIRQKNTIKAECMVPL